ncbi:MAG TPA: Gfo/Idh/MocA family oxidoreductase [Rhizomicrobium sp.]|nr:Gfo/Idh/MocA family oxidoreductase [Rhizomicrobium sp.]
MAAESRPLGFIGAGWVFRNCYAPHLRGAAGPFSLTAVHDPDPAARAAAREMFAGIAAVESLDALLGLCGAVVIASPNATHLEIAERCLDAGAHCLIEKPVAVEREDARRLTAAALRGGAICKPAAVCQFRRDVVAWRSMIVKIGTLETLDLRWCRADGVPTTRDWQLRRDRGWTGVLADLGYHLVDLAGAVLDYPGDAFVLRKAERRSKGRATGPKWLGPRCDARYDVDDWIDVEGRIGDVAIRVNAAWCEDGRTGDVTELVARGSQGTARLDGLFGFSTQRAVEGQVCRLTDSAGRVLREQSFAPGPGLHEEAFGAMLEDFASCLRSRDGRSERQVRFAAGIMQSVAAT